MKVLKKVGLILIIIMISAVINTSNYSKSATLTEILTGGDKFLSNANDEELFNSENEQSAIDQVYYILLGIGIVLALVIGIILGIQFITSGVAGQAKIKEKLIPFVIGCFIIFGAFGIWRIVLNTANKILPTQTYGPTEAPDDIDEGTSHTDGNGGSHGGGGGSF